MDDAQRAATKQLSDLCDIAPASRDAAWFQSFFSVFPKAILKGRTPQVVRGPDGFPYFVVDVPQPGEEFQAFQPGEIIKHCVEKGFGIVLNPDEEPPDFVFPFGALWSYETRKEFYPASQVKAAPGEREQTLEEGREVMVGQPSEDFFPKTAQRAVATFLKFALGVETPSCFVMMDPKQVPERSLVFNVFPTQFPNKDAFFGALRALGWFFPNDYIATAIDQDSPLAEHFRPLPLPTST